MSRMIFVNLPVIDLSKAKAFYAAIGFTNNPQFTDETAACMVLTETIYVMLLTREKFAQFTTREIADSQKTAQMLLALSCDSRGGVDEITEAAIATADASARPEDLVLQPRLLRSDATVVPFPMDIAGFEAAQHAEPARPNCHDQPSSRLQLCAAKAAAWSATCACAGRSKRWSNLRRSYRTGRAEEAEHRARNPFGQVPAYKMASLLFASRDRAHSRSEAGRADRSGRPRALY